MKENIILFISIHLFDLHWLTASLKNPKSTRTLITYYDSNSNYNIQNLLEL